MPLRSVVRGCAFSLKESYRLLDAVGRPPAPWRPLLVVPTIGEKGVRHAGGWGREELKSSHARDFYSLFLTFFGIFQSLIDTKRSLNQHFQK